MSDKAFIASLSDLDIVGLTLYGEARGEGLAGLEAVGSVILNRTKRPKRFGATPREVCLSPWQFSCWQLSAGPYDYAALIAEAHKLANGQIDSTTSECLAVAKQVLDGSLPDSVLGSTHYVTTALYKAAPPAWASGKTPAIVINHQMFFNGIL